MNVNYVGDEPFYATEDSAGGDLRTNKSYRISPQSQVTIETTTRMKIPKGYFGMLVPRSSLCNKGGLVLVNSIGIIDADYTGVIKLVYKNNGGDAVFIEEGERIGQIVITNFIKPTFTQVEELEETERGDGGYGHTGTK